MVSEGGHNEGSVSDYTYVLRTKHWKRMRVGADTYVGILQPYGYGYGYGNARVWMCTLCRVR